MPPSQLKQLKASLHEHGVLGPQKSKKQRKANSKDAQKRLQRNAALDGIRERFNPFETKTSARPQKYEVVSNKEVKRAVERPGVARGLGEERRRETLLREIQNRNKVGGLLDRRFGENDPTLTPEQKAAERFARQNERKLRKTSTFNLEDDDEEEVALTHGGRSLDFGDQVKDDYEQDEIDLDEAEVFDAQDDRPRKRVRLDDDDEQGTDEENMLPERKKSKNEVMKEVIAKSKLHKAERQAAKADDEDIRMALDQGISEMYEALRSHKPPERTLPTPPSDSEPHMDPSRAAMLAGKSREEAEKEYEANVRQMKLDARSKPTFRTKTEEERAAEEAEMLQELERKRIRRMRGEADSSEDEEEDEAGVDEDLDPDDAEAFGLDQPEVYAPRKELDVEDEDEFVLDDDLLASGSEVEMDSDDQGSAGSELEDDGDDDFINGLVLPAQSKPIGKLKTTSPSNLAFTYPCPQTHEEFLESLQGKNLSDLPTIVQRIRALYHKGLAEDNHEKLGNFAHVLLQHVVYMVDAASDVHLEVVESLLRHLHSMAKSQPNDVASAYRAHLTKISEERPLQLTAGDLMVLTAISKTFPTSDHFHPVVTPAILTIARYLGQSSVQSLQDLGIGAYASSLALQYQGLAKRYVPEVVSCIVNAFAILSPTPMKETLGSEAGLNEGRPLNVPIRLPEKSLRIVKSSINAPKQISFKYLLPQANPTPGFAATLLNTFINLAQAASNLWSSKSANPELLTPLIHSLHHISTHTSLPTNILTLATSTLTSLSTTLTQSITSRRPLLLHNHRPLAIKSSYPQFIDSYNPSRHYDPDRERAELAKLCSEHKKERKGAMRELRKDANFIAREQLREKKEKDEAYEKKFKRLVAEIQGEEGREGKEYDRERRKRRGKS